MLDFQKSCNKIEANFARQRRERLSSRERLAEAGDRELVGEAKGARQTGTNRDGEVFVRRMLRCAMPLCGNRVSRPDHIYCSSCWHQNSATHEAANLTADGVIRWKNLRTTTFVHKGPPPEGVELYGRHPE